MQDQNNKPISRSSSNEDLTEGNETPIQKLAREKLTVGRSELVEMVDAARRKRAAELKARNELAEFEFKNKGVVTKTGIDEDVHGKHKSFVAQLRDKQLKKTNEITPKK